MLVRCVYISEKEKCVKSADREIGYHGTPQPQGDLHALSQAVLCTAAQEVCPLKVRSVSSLLKALP